MDIKSILPIIAVTIVMSLLSAASKKKPKKDDEGNIILQLPLAYSIIGILVIIGGVGLVIFTIFFAKANEQIPAFISSLVLFAGGYLLFAKGYISNIKVTDIGIQEVTMFSRQKEIKWNDITSLSFGSTSLELKISSSNHNIKAHMHLIGFQDFIAKLEKQTGKTKAEMGIPEK